MTTNNQQEQLYRTILIKDRNPEYGVPVFAMMEWMSGKKIGGYLIRVSEDDCEWRTVDDNSEIDYSLNVVSWLEPYTPPVEDGKLGGEVWKTGFTIINHNTAKWTKAQIDKNNETENRMVFENFHVSDMGRSRRLICTCATKEQASEVVEKYNAALKSQPSTPVHGLEIIRELVRLKNIKDDLDSVPKEMEDQAHVIRYGQYVIDKSKAWKAAREFLQTISPLPSPPVNKQD